VDHKKENKKYACGEKEKLVDRALQFRSVHGRILFAREFFKHWWDPRPKSPHLVKAEALLGAQPRPI
jgi:hypothetical protein